MDFTEASIPVDTEKNNGKKRQREQFSVAPKPSKGTCPRQPKKAKQLAAPDDQDISKAFNIAKPHTKRLFLLPEGSGDFSLGTSVQKHVHFDDDPSETTETGFSPGIIQDSPLRKGLGSIYQAAFQDEEWHTDTDRFTGPRLSVRHTIVVPNTHRRAAFETVSPSTIVGTSRPHQEAQSSWDQIAYDSALQVPCSSGVLTDTGNTSAEPIEAADLTTSFACLEQGLDKSTDWHSDARQIEVTTLMSQVVASLDHSIDYGEHPDMKDDPMDVDDAELSFLMSEFTNIEGEANKASPEHFIDPVDLSLSSDIGRTVSSPSDDIEICLDTTFVEPSSSYLLFRSHLPTFPTKGEVSDDPFLEVEQQSIDELTYNDEDLEAVLESFDSPPSAQLPQSTPLTSSKEEPPTTEPLRWAFSDSITPITSPPSPANPYQQDMAPPPPPSMANSSMPKDIPHKVSFDQNGNPIPFVRPPFAPPIRDRSPVIGLSNRTVLRACFRIGEALNAGSTALRTKTDAVIELYARVVHSERPPGSVKQQFQFADIFSSDKPPFLKGTYGLWKGVELWDLDSKVFLGEKGQGKMARVVGRMVRDEKTRDLEMMMLSVWEADWDDVGICKGHYCE